MHINTSESSRTATSHVCVTVSTCQCQSAYRPTKVPIFTYFKDIRPIGPPEILKWVT